MLPARCMKPPCRNIEVKQRHRRPASRRSSAGRLAPVEQHRRDEAEAVDRRRASWLRPERALPEVDQHAGRDQRDRDDRLARGRIVVVERNHAQRLAAVALGRAAPRSGARARSSPDVGARSAAGARFGARRGSRAPARAVSARKLRTVSQIRSTSLGRRLLMQRQADHPAGLARGDRHLAAAVLERRLLEQVRVVHGGIDVARGELGAQAVALARPAPGSAGCTRRSRRWSGAASARPRPGPRAGGSSARPAPRAARRSRRAARCSANATAAARSSILYLWPIRATCWVGLTPAPRCGCRCRRRGRGRPAG